MEHKGTVSIETSRLLLRRFNEKDAEAAYKNWESDAKVTKYLRWQTYDDVHETERVIDEWIRSYHDLSFYQWAIELKEIGEPIGSISVVEQDECTNKVHIGYCIGSRWWHQGITTEAFKAIIPFLFNEVKADRIEAQHDPDNPHSGNVMKKCGLKYEGTLRKADWSNRGIVDACMYSLLREEWMEERI
ncbi:MAG: GNAT family protein [Peptoniphilaceae bacterium]|nr:GNAT family protein [Peptoniphilaceae bacterium]MDY6086247.1 GNAT family protein [Peptoniphilaceae bacterium]